MPDFPHVTVKFLAHYRYHIFNFWMIDCIEVLAITLQAKYVFHAVTVLLLYILCGSFKMFPESLYF